MQLVEHVEGELEVLAPRVGRLDRPGRGGWSMAAPQGLQNGGRQPATPLRQERSPFGGRGSGSG
ncbi:hypothetical protein [Streptomyces sp. NPDC093225]|uniref:hypothetical protein n=1 Tax=Streptomyces sp. NPDC093225 TaxID=3366034 RepID=UPI00382BABC8